MTKAEYDKTYPRPNHKALVQEEDINRQPHANQQGQQRQTVSVGDYFSLKPKYYFTDPEGDAIIYDYILLDSHGNHVDKNYIAWLDFNSHTGELRGTPNKKQVFYILVLAKDSKTRTEITSVSFRIEII